MKHTMKMAVVLAVATSGVASAQDILSNPSFEYGWSGWKDVDPNKDATSISGHANTGEKSAKITKETGRFEQEVTIQPESEYVLKAVVKGAGLIGVSFGDETLMASSAGEGEAWLPLEIPFSSAQASSLVIFGAHSGSEGRFDDFELVAVSGPALIAAQEAAKGPKVYATIPDSCDRINQLGIRDASDDGTNDGHTPELAIDGSFEPNSRWSSKLIGKELVLDMKFPQTLKEVGVAFYKGNERKTFFDLEVSANGTDYKKVLEDVSSSGISTAIERFDFDDSIARYFKIVGKGNEGSEWNSIVEVQAFGCGLGEIEAQSDGSDAAQVAGISMYGLETGKPPSENFDLSHWKITLPVDLDGDGRADEIEEAALDGWSDDNMFYTDPVTGGMVFRVIGGMATTQNSSYPRVELREMLRGGDLNIGTRINDGTPNKNNWVFSAAPSEVHDLAGGVDGTLTAKLQINRVTRQGEGSQVGRVIIGQIHAKDDEPIRLYYRKLPTNKFGSIYYIHEVPGKDDVYVPVIGDRSDFLKNPDDGIALDENFSYEIKTSGKDIDGVIHPILSVSITRDDGSVVRAPDLDMFDSGYAPANDFMYFKAGAYAQNNTTPDPERDFVQVTFLELMASH